MNTRVARRIMSPSAALIVALMALVVGCDTPFSGPELAAPNAPGNDPAAVITVLGNSFTLAWVEKDSDVVTYRVYGRVRGATQWVVIDGDVCDQQLTITKDDLPYGTYEFAVSSINRDGEESALHHSFDDSADPSPWILRWVSG